MVRNDSPAVELLIAQIEELERKANAYKVAVNVLCAKDGLPPMYSDAGGGDTSFAIGAKLYAFGVDI